MTGPSIAILLALFPNAKRFFELKTQRGHPSLFNI